MSLLEPRFHSFSSIHETPQQGWAFCMSKAYCKWPTIIGIVVAVLVFFLTIYCCYRCCCRRRRGRGGRNRANTASMFNPAPYQGYQPANNPNNAPPPYNEPPRFAQFDTPSNKKITEDSLPAMPSWDNARTTKVETPGDDMEMGKLGPQGHNAMSNTANNASSVNLLPPGQTQGYVEADSHPVSPHYTGPDFGHGAGHPYTGPDFLGRDQNTAYKGYAPSMSTRYEPTGVNEAQELGTTYSNTMPPPSPSAHQQSFQGQHAPSVLQAGRRTAGNGNENSWRDV
ncbi:hypothetical protein N7G274_002810 [Stereocaulon virgatum]|uniref:Uncharacterized protein n=1 Tax=Stereocaulon virgatum TaxID=373712 RepID=A0ABR4AH06_9LECA